MGTPSKMQILWKYLKPQKWLIVIALILAAISQLLNLIDPVIFGKSIDEYAPLLVRLLLHALHSTTYFCLRGERVK